MTYLTLFFLNLYNLRRSLFAVATLCLFGNGGGKLQESLPVGALGMQGYGLSVIAALADALNDGNLREQGHVHLLGKARDAALSEDVVFVVGKFFGCKPRHVLVPGGVSSTR